MDIIPSCTSPSPGPSPLIPRCRRRCACGQVQSWWTGFARDGDPNRANRGDAAAPQWTSYGDGKGGGLVNATMGLRVPLAQSGVQSGLKAAQCDLWDTLQPLHGPY